ncbi:MAG: 2'-deoxycytidine 5'-triphosphate deaminase [Pseudomonadota bacterium]
MAIDTSTGVLPAEMIRSLIDGGKVRATGGVITAPQIQPASLDLTLGPRAWRVRASFLPSRKRRVADCLTDDLLMQEIALTDGAVFERSCVYLVELNEALALPNHIEGSANPKSSTGRIDVFVRLVTDYAASFDQVHAGYQGPLYAEICPRSFSILAHEGVSLNQLRFKTGPCTVDGPTLESTHTSHPLTDDPEPDFTGGLGVRVQIGGANDEIIGYRARRHAGLIDLDRVSTLTSTDYFEPIHAPKSGFIILDPDEFYILASREALTIPAHLAAEMTPISPGLGEFRVHYAGFFDPGFGTEHPSRGVLEVRSHDAPFVLEDGQLVARLVYERMHTAPKNPYGSGVRSNYQGQGLKLSKHFKA